MTLSGNISTPCFSLVLISGIMIFNQTSLNNIFLLLYYHVWFYQTILWLRFIHKFKPTLNVSYNYIWNLLLTYMPTIMFAALFLLASSFTKTHKYVRDNNQWYLCLNTWLFYLQLWQIQITKFYFIFFSSLFNSSVILFINKWQQTFNVSLSLPVNDSCI